MFDRIFREGMLLVEETAAYLDGPGRRESRELGRTAAMAYATESMRLTTRLMQLASWLLLQRAVRDGEMTAEEARQERYRIDLARCSDAGGNTDGLPETLSDLIARSDRLHTRIRALDRMLNADSKPIAARPSPVSHQMSLLRAAFGRPMAAESSSG